MLTRPTLSRLRRQAGKNGSGQSPTFASFGVVVQVLDIVGELAKSLSVVASLEDNGTISNKYGKFLFIKIVLETLDHTKHKMRSHRKQQYLEYLDISKACE